MSETTEPKVTDLDSALTSILEPVQEETTEAIIEEETQATEEATEEVVETAESDIEEDVESDQETEDEEIYASDSDDENHLEDASYEEPQAQSSFTVKVDGVEQQVTLDDLKQGYSGQQYVQKGMQEAAQQKKEVESVYTALTNERQQLAELYQSLQSGGFEPPPVKPTKEYFDADPIGYMQKNLEYEEKMGGYNAKMAQLEQVTQKQSEAQQNAKQAYLQEQMQVLQREIPEFAEPQKATRLKEQLVNVGQNHYGYTADEIGLITDARAIKVLNDAMKYQDIINGKSKAKVKVKSKTPMVKPGAKKMPTPNAKIRSRQKAKLRDSGSIDDALGLILNS